jgi:hypothetical protein
VTFDEITLTSFLHIVRTKNLLSTKEEQGDLFLEFEHCRQVRICSEDWECPKGCGAPHLCGHGNLGAPTFWMVTPDDPA